MFDFNHFDGSQNLQTYVSFVMNCYLVCNDAQKSHTVSRRTQGSSYCVPNSHRRRKFGRISFITGDQPIRVDRANCSKTTRYCSWFYANGGMLGQLADRYSREIDETLAELESLRAKLREIQALQSVVSEFPTELTS